MSATHMASKTPKSFLDGEKNLGQQFLKTPDSLKKCPIGRIRPYF